MPDLSQPPRKPLPGGLVVGIVALLWVIIRSGTNPRRLTYPCQQAALATALGLIAEAGSVAAVVLLVGRIRREANPRRLLALVACFALLLGLHASVTTSPLPVQAASPILPAWISPAGLSNVFAVTNVPAPAHSLDGGTIPSGIAPDVALRDAGVDALLALMASHDEPFHRTAAHPEGLFGASDVIVIKPNNQWDGRNGTNSDVLKGIIYQLVSHPEGFTGAVVIAENPQTTNADWYSEPSGNNSQFTNQSYQEVASAFASVGRHVCIADWRLLRTTFVSDYDAGNATNGYVLDAADPKLAYPKFEVDCAGTSLRVSMRKGLWNGSSFDSTRLRMINLPVLKRHGGAAATIAIKNYIGFITTDDSSGRFGGNNHCFMVGPGYGGNTCAGFPADYGLIGRQLALIRRADLDIVDAIWVNPKNNSGWHGEARRQDILMASRDPFALDYYASEFLLGPLVHSTYPTDTTWTQVLASTHGGVFRSFLERNAVRLRALGVTNAITLDDTWTAQQELDQFSVYVQDATTPIATPLLSISNASVAEGDAGTRVITLTVTLSE